MRFKNQFAIRKQHFIMGCESIGYKKARACPSINKLLSFGKYKFEKSIVMCIVYYKLMNGKKALFPI